ncbi:MAG: S1C family serine protease, partial [Acidimicrobiia bacterium]
GSSGGALVDGEGSLIGITTAVGVSAVGIEGIGFATPVEIVQRVVGELIAGGEASRPFLGLTGSTAFGDTTDGGRRPTGVDVDGVEPGSAAAEAGLRPGDVITAVDDRTIDTMDELIALLRRYRSADTIELSVLRGPDAVVMVATLGNRPT